MRGYHRRARFSRSLSRFIADTFGRSADACEDTVVASWAIAVSSKRLQPAANPKARAGTGMPRRLGYVACAVMAPASDRVEVMAMPSVFVVPTAGSDGRGDWVVVISSDSEHPFRVAATVRTRRHERKGIAAPL